MKLTPAFAELLIAPAMAVLAIEAPISESPAAGAVVYALHPHFRWVRERNVWIDEEHRIQIGRNTEFTDLVCDDRLEVVSRFVSATQLAPSKYWWRVRRGEGDWSTSGLGSNIIIRGNRIAETREAAMAIKGCDGVRLLNNEFRSSTVPKQGAWITAEKTKNLRTSGNKHTAEVPELKTDQQAF